MHRVHYSPGDGAGWALDEDLRQIRSALAGRVVECGAGSADIIHAPFWQNLKMVAPAILESAYVIAHADNPPYFYLKQAEFSTGQKVVDLWVARSREALGQFQSLDLPVVHIPYTIDPALFFSIEDRAGLRREFGLPEDAYIVANFHRDTEGADLRTPKFQKAPELMVAILKRVREAGRDVHVLLAGPRRHWIRRQLAAEGIPFTFVGRHGLEGDDFGENILTRQELNRLYNAADLYLIPSRWEGGPQSAMEAAACRCKILSVPVGVSRDILEADSIFQSAGEAAEKIVEDVRSGRLSATVARQFERFRDAHTTDRLRSELQSLYDRLEDDPAVTRKRAKRAFPAWCGVGVQFAHTVRRRLRRRCLPPRVFWNHRDGEASELDGIMAAVRRSLDEWGVQVSGDAGCPVELVGRTREAVGKGKSLVFTCPGEKIPSTGGEARFIVPSVQDALNLRRDGLSQAVSVIPTLAALAPGEGPLLVEEGDTQASLRVWAALKGGHPVAYPASSAYGEQVFHAGLAWGERIARADAPAALAERAAEFSALIRIPTEAESSNMLRQLLEEMS